MRKEIYSCAELKIDLFPATDVLTLSPSYEEDELPISPKQNEEEVSEP